MAMAFFSLYLGKRQKPRRKFAKIFFLFLLLGTPDFLWKIGVSSLEDLFFSLEVAWKFFFGEHLRLCSRSWPREGLFWRSWSLALATDFFVFLALASKVVSPTLPLVKTKKVLLSGCLDPTWYCAILW